MEISHPERPQLIIDPEQYREVNVDIVHRGSLDRVVSGKKRSDITTIKEAKLIQERIARLLAAGIEIRFIDEQLIFEPLNNNRQVVLGGAFDGQCLRDYMDSAKKQGIVPIIDSLLALRLD